MDLKEILKPRGGTSQVRIYDEDKPEFEDLQRQLTIQIGGEPVPTAAVIHYLLMVVKAAGKFIRQEPPDLE